jgi:hypothetical protein
MKKRQTCDVQLVDAHAHNGLCEVECGGRPDQVVAAVKVAGQQVRSGGAHRPEGKQQQGAKRAEQQVKVVQRQVLDGLACRGEHNSNAGGRCS